MAKKPKWIVKATKTYWSLYLSREYGIGGDRTRNVKNAQAMTKDLVRVNPKHDFWYTLPPATFDRQCDAQEFKRKFELFCAHQEGRLNCHLTDPMVEVERVPLY